MEQVYKIKRSDSSLYHHGIDGQKWGVRHGPPYPLDYRRHSAKEKQKNSKHSLSKYDTGSTQSKHNPYTKSRNLGDAKRVHTHRVSKIMDSSKSNSEKEKAIGQENRLYKRKLSELTISDQTKQRVKTALKISGGVAVASIIAYGGYKYLSKMPVTNDAVIDNMLKAAQTTKNYKVVMSRQLLNDFASKYSVKLRSSAEGFNNVYTSMQYAAYDSFASKLTTQDIHAIQKYTGNSYIPMNRALRGLAKPNNEIKAAIDSLTNALEKCRTSEPLLVHRSMGSMSSLAKTLGVPESMLKNPTFLNSLKTSGYTYIDPAFHSSCAIKEGAGGLAFSGIRLHTVVPQGSKAMYVAPISSFKHENEVLIQRNSAFKIIDFQLDPQGQITDVFLELVDQIL